MRERWVDMGSGRLGITTDTLCIRLQSKAHKNYRNTHSNWRLYFSCRGQYGYCCVFSYEFGGTMEEALYRTETIIKEMHWSIQEII